MRQGLLDQSLATFQLALSLTSAASATADLKTARAATLNNLGCLFKRMNQYDEAMVHLQTARDLEVELQGGASCSTMLNLCTVLLAMGRVDDAIPLAKLCVSKAGEDHYLYVVSLHNLAVTQQSSSDANERRHATSTMLKALGESRKRLGEAHPTTMMLREKCGVAPPPTTIAPRQPLTAKPPQPKRNEIEFARQALRTLDFATPTESNQAPQRTGSNHGHQAQPPPIPMQRRDDEVMEGALFSSEPQEPHVKHAASTLTEHHATSNNNAAEAVNIASVAASQDEVVLGTPTAATVTAPGTAMRFYDGTPSADGLTNNSITNPAPPAAIETRASNSLTHSGSPSPTNSKRGPTTPQPTAVAHSSSSGVGGAYGNVVTASLSSSVLNLQRRGISLDKPPSFVRFGSSTVPPPPLPTTFTDIRNEMKFEKERKRIAELAAAHDAENSAALEAAEKARISAQQQAARLHALQVAERKKHRLEQEDREEKALRDQRDRAEQQARLEAIKREQLEAIERERHNRCACRIQRAYRRWWQTFGFSKYLKHSAASNLSNTERKKKTQQQIQSGASGAGAAALYGQSNVSRAVLKCAKKWLEKTAGRRLVLRLGAAKKTGGFSRVQMCVQKIQKVWRKAIAKLRRQRKQQQFRLMMNAVCAHEKRDYAAKKIQCLIRQHLAKKELVRRKTNHYWGHVCRLQRWFRRILAARASAGIRAKRIMYHSKAAVTIQRVWRGYLGRLRTVMLRLKSKVAALKRKDFTNSQNIQRFCRGFQTRRVLSRAHAAQTETKRKEQLLKGLPQYAIPSSSVNSSVATTHPSARYADEARLRAAQVHTITEGERETFYIPLVVESQATRLREEYLQRQNPHQLRLQRAGEEHQRSLELQTLRRLRAAKLIQAVYRRWKHLRTVSSKRSIAYSHHIYQKKRFETKEQERAAEAERARLMELNDLAKDARALKEATKRELAEVEPTVRRYLPADELRDPESRASDIKDLKLREARMNNQKAHDAAQRQHLPTFMTLKQQRLSLEQQ